MVDNFCLVVGSALMELRSYDAYPCFIFNFVTVGMKLLQMGHEARERCQTFLFL